MLFLNEISTEDYEYDGVQLLNWEGNRSPELVGTSTIALAQIAEVIHQKAKFLSPDQSEEVVRWVKAWKLKGKPMRANHEIYAIMNDIRNSPEQLILQRKSYAQTIWSRLVGLLFSISLAITLFLGFARDFSWYSMAACLIVNLALFVFSDRFTVKALIIAKEQDRRYFYQCLRTAQSIYELNVAGLFGYIPGTDPNDAGYTEERWLDATTAERDRFSDALYFDPTSYMRPN